MGPPKPAEAARGQASGAAHAMRGCAPRVPRASDRGLACAGRAPRAGSGWPVLLLSSRSRIPSRLPLGLHNEPPGCREACRAQLCDRSYAHRSATDRREQSSQDTRLSSQRWGHAWRGKLHTGAPHRPAPRHARPRLDAERVGAPPGERQPSSACGARSPPGPRACSTAGSARHSHARKAREGWLLLALDTQPLHPPKYAPRPRIQARRGLAARPHPPSPPHPPKHWRGVRAAPVGSLRGKPWYEL